MDAYDSAVLSYALATAANKNSRNLLDILPGTSTLTRVDEISLTPPTRGDYKENLDQLDHQRGLFFQRLCKIEQNLVERAPLHAQDLMEICTLKQLDTQTSILVDNLQNEIRHLFKHCSSITLDAEERKKRFSKYETMCKILIELCLKYGLSEGVNVLRNYLT